MGQSSNLRVPIGEVIADRYRIEGEIGQGGFGSVFEATRLDNGERVALKVMHANYGTSESDAKRFQREASLVQKLRHPCVVQILDFGHTHHGTPFIAFELLRGTALDDLIDEAGGLPVQRVAEISRDVLAALDAAHAMGIVHRDIKPGNVFLCGGGRSKVLDFGVAKALKGEEAMGTQLTAVGQMVGTPHYMSPEQVRGNEVGPATDLYALGLVMAEMLCGEKIVEGEALIEIYMIHIDSKPFEFPAVVVQSPLGPLIARATAKEVEGRYRSAGEMLGELERVMAEEGQVVQSTRLMVARSSEAPESGPVSGSDPHIDLGSTIPITDLGATVDDNVLRAILQAEQAAHGNEAPVSINMAGTMVMQAIDLFPQDPRFQDVGNARPSPPPAQLQYSSSAPSVPMAPVPFHPIETAPSSPPPYAPLHSMSYPAGAPQRGGTRSILLAIVVVVVMTLGLIVVGLYLTGLLK